MINPLPAKLSLESRIDEERFSHQSLLVPLAKDRETQSITSQFFDQVKYLSLPTPVLVPTEDKEYRQSCEYAFLGEKAIHSLLVTDRARLDNERIATFDFHLLSSPVTRNLLSRMQMVRETGRFMGAGIYLGTETYDRSMIESTLLNALDQAYRAADLTPSNPVSLRAACGLWGMHQPSARMSILKATWANLIGNQKWSMPDGFRRNMSRLLEHEFPPALRKPHTEVQNTNYQLTSQDKDSFYDWFSHVELLHERRTNPLSVEQILKTTSSATPLHTFREGPLVRGINITQRQALDHWSSYVSIPTLRWVEVATPALQHPRHSNNQQRTRTEYISGEIRALAQTPLAPFIASLRADISGSTMPDALFLFGQWRRCLSSLSLLNPWRDESSPHTVRCIFTNASSAVKDKMLQLYSNPTSHGPLVHLSEAQTFSTNTQDASVVFSATLAPRR